MRGVPGQDRIVDNGLVEQRLQDDKGQTGHDGERHGQRQSPVRPQAADHHGHRVTSADRGGICACEQRLILVAGYG